MSIERSTELLRQALPWMSRQAAALHPVSYAVWFDYVAQTNAPLRAAIDEHLAREGTLDEFATHALFSRHIADVDPETAQRVVEQMQRVLGGIGVSAGTAGAHAARYSASLAQLAGALARGDTARGIDDADATGLARNGPAPRKLADVVAEAMRTLVPAGATLARVDGAAFALLVPELDAAGALALAERLRAHIGSARIRRPDHGEAERVTLSLGVAGGHAGELPEALLERATAALKQAKDGGRDRVASAS